jgi:hypothetical protein
MKKYKKQLILWGNVIYELLKEKPEEIYRQLLIQDRNLELIEELKGDLYNREYYYSINSINGFQRYFEKYGKQF